MEIFSKKTLFRSLGLQKNFPSPQNLAPGLRHWRDAHINLYPHVPQ